MGSADHVLDDLESAAIPANTRIVAVPNTSLAQLQARQRREKSTTPATVLVVARDGDWLRVVGPTPDRESRVTPDALRRLLTEASEMSALDGARHLARELPLLDERENAGLAVNGLGTRHVFADRLRTSPRWAAFATAAQQADRSEWRALLRSLGYVVEQLPREGYVVRYEGAPIAVAMARSSVADFTRLDAEGRLPSGLLLSLCRSEGAPYGLLVAGTRFRLYATGEQSAAAASRFLELDTSLLGDDDAPLIGLLGPDSLAGGGFAALVADAEAYGQSLRERLDRVLRQAVLPGLGLALGRWAVAEHRDLRDPDLLEELEAAALTFVFRVVFLLHAEAAGFLPMENATYRARSMTNLCERAGRESATAQSGASSCWDDFRNLVGRVRAGHPAWNLPAYNGDLFAPDGMAGAEVLEAATIDDAIMTPVLAALGRDPDDGSVGLDYSGIGIEHLGYVYEGLLSLRLTPAERPYRYDATTDRYVGTSSEDAEVETGELLWLTNEGGRKRQGVYYTPTVIVQHLVRTGIRPAFADHLARVRATAETDPATAAADLLDFYVLDPACGSAHFLVEAVNELADQVALFVAEVPLPGIRDQLDGLRASAGVYGALVDDTALVRRLVLKRCIYGIDISPLGAEIAKISLWLATFVPGLALSFLDHNIRRGNSLVGVADLDELSISPLQAAAIRARVEQASAAARGLSRIDDATPDAYRESRLAADEIELTLAGADIVCDLVTAGYLGIAGVRDEIDRAGVDFLDGRTSTLSDDAGTRCSDEHALHWPLALPEVFGRDGPGFDAVIGNPPWDEVTVEELAFYTRYRPRLRSLDAAAQKAEIANLVAERSDLPSLLDAERALLAEQRAYFHANPAYPGSSGDPDVAKLFARRYATLLRDGGTLAVVLPRTLTSSKGGTDFRAWLMTDCFPRRVDFLKNRGRWAFDITEQYTIALITASKGGTRGSAAAFEVAGVAGSRAEFDAQVARAGVATKEAALGVLREIPLLGSQSQADLLAHVREGRSIVFGGGRWRCFPVGELHETNDKHFWRDADDGLPLWKGESFDRYLLAGTGERRCPISDPLLAKVLKPRPGGESAVAAVTSLGERRSAVRRTWGRARIAFRDVSRSTDARTMRAALIPPNVLLTNKAPYLAFVDDAPVSEAACLGVLNSLAFDWQARRFVEINMNFYIFEGLRMPDIGAASLAAIAARAARLSCVDDRFADFADANGVDVGPLDADARSQLDAEIDALVAVAYGLDDEEMELVFGDFTLAAVPEAYRERVRRELRELRR